MYLRPSVGSGRKAPTDQHHEFHERASSDVLSKSFPRQQRTTQTRATEQSTDHERFDVLLKGFPRQQQRTTRTRVGEQYTDHERADFLLKGLPKGFPQQQQTTRFGSIDHDVVLKRYFPQQQKKST